MTCTNKSLRVGLTPPSQCPYLPQQQEQLLVIQDELDAESYAQLLAQGFRRSGDIVYRPHCRDCQACMPLRIPIMSFTASSQQRRTLNKNRSLHWQVTNQQQAQHYALYEKYICQRHADGDMYPPSPAQFEQFLSCCWHQPHFLELYRDTTLIAVAVTDVLPDSLSAVYTYFDPDEEKRSLGTLMVLLQQQVAKQQHKAYLYLGFQIDDNHKMSYKRRFRPYQILTNSGWHTGTNIKPAKN
ncbi:putative arginyl-tRNA--protein transferase [Shewanella sp. NFH-SH190041]|uniref:arginyltransferase n=1 Tax=Shewanella sp. NFH-SH190041 TaxID=2950245 RepID=UPI0021C4B2F0|nr:arginyltransferase [Shewanella sp. NFH-SH190041]BDM64918.1 putative arginyl-tRNA--protein transferase [Shewanella sp. NFH-SH190041]